MKRPLRPVRGQGEARVRTAPQPQGPRELVLEAIGARGDATATDSSRPDGRGTVYVPFGLPGERVRVELVGERAASLEVLEPSADRREPACAHFGRCGGCQLQHWAEAPYLAWKRARVCEALERVGLRSDCVLEAAPAWGAGRRRAALHAARSGKSLRVGFIERGGARLTPISQCPVLVPELEAALGRLEELAALFTPTRGEITLQCLWTEAGLDVSIKGAGRAAGLDRIALERASAAADTADLARLSLDGEPIVMRRMPVLRMGRAIVAPPPGAFLQPTAEGEDLLARLAMEAIAGASRCVDLFSGIGTFSLRAASFAEVLAVETDSAMLEALKRAADGAGGALKQVDVVRRDLLRTPLSSLEMKKIDAAILDPPRSGARLQAEQLGRAGVRKLAYVSCDPVSFARDVRVLNEYGFDLKSVTPVDQFRWSPHVEMVGALER